MDLGHRIVALVAGKPKRVVCMTCNSEHTYRPPKALSATGPAPARASSPPKSRQKPAASVNEWEQRVAGQGAAAFIRFSMHRTFRRGDLVVHSKFGEGYVADVLEDGKVSIVFRDGPRTLAHGQS
jgi:hypothetical protein